MEEVLMLQPQNHIFHLKYAEILYTQDNIQLALKQFCRVVELCGDHVRGLYGIKMVTLRRYVIVMRLIWGAKCGSLETNRFITLVLLSECAIVRFALVEGSTIKRRSSNVARGFGGYGFVGHRAFDRPLWRSWCCCRVVKNCCHQVDRNPVKGKNGNRIEIEQSDQIIHDTPPRYH